MKKIYVFTLLLIIAFATNAQTLTEVLVPQYIQGLNGTNATRVPFAYRLTLSGLAASTTYRYINAVVIASDAATSGGAGNAIYPVAAGAFIRSTGPSLSSAGNYGTFITDAGGNYTGWFITEPTGSATRFIPGTQVFFRIILNDGAGGTTAVTRLTTTSFATVINFGTSDANTGTGIRMTANSKLTPSNFIMLYDNGGATGRPITGTMVESDGTANTVANSYVPFYANNVDAVPRTWGAIIPNNLPNGIRRIQEYSLTTGSGTVSAVSSNGVYPASPGGTVDTKNPATGTAELVLDGGSVVFPVTLLSFTASAQTNRVIFNWKTAQESNTSHFEIEQSANGSDFNTMATIAAAGNSAVEKSYTYTGNFAGIIMYYRLKTVDVDGKLSTSTVVKVAGLKNGFELGSVYPIPAKDNVTIQWNSNRAGTTAIVVTDLSGKTVRSTSVQSVTGFNQFALDVQSFNAGQYFVRLISGTNQVQTVITRQ